MSRYMGKILFRLRTAHWEGYRLSRHDAIQILNDRRSDISACYMTDDDPVEVADWLMMEHFEGSNNV